MPRAKKPPRPAGYGNRTDLLSNATRQPIVTPTGGAYGSAQASSMSQKAVPLPQAGAMSSPMLGGGGGIAGPGSGSPSGPGASPPVAPNDPAAAINAAQGMTLPNLNFGGPTDRPGEPITTGMSVGPGAGPIAPPDPVITAVASLNMLHPDQVDPDTARLMAAMNNHVLNRAAP